MAFEEVKYSTPVTRDTRTDDDDDLFNIYLFAYSLFIVYYNNALTVPVNYCLFNITYGTLGGEG